MTRPLKIGSLFAGIGGFDLGLERTGGFETAWFCEIEEYPRSILNQWWPGVPVYDDVTKLKGDEVEPVDILVGGFPCQDISAAGRGEGIGGERSSLWFEFARLVGELRPRYVIAENSPLLKTRGLNAVLGSLAEVGYDAEWDCVPARTFGAPHQRDRIWVVAYPDSAHSQGDGSAQRNEAEVSGSGDACPYRESGRGDGETAVADSEREGLQGTAGPRFASEGREAVFAPSESERPFGAWPPEPDLAGVVDELPSRLDGAKIDVEQSSDTKTRSTRPTGTDEVRSVRGDRQTAISSSCGLQSAGEGSGFVLNVPSKSGRGGRDETHQEGEGMCDLREDVHGLQPFSGEDLLEAMSQRAWPSERFQALGWWDIEPPVDRVARGVDKRPARVKALGNALVPVIPEYIGLRILEWEDRNAGS